MVLVVVLVMLVMLVFCCSCVGIVLLVDLCVGVGVFFGGGVVDGVI